MRNKMILLVLAVCLLFCACEFSLPQIEYGFSREISPEEQKLETEIKKKGYLYPYKILFCEPKVLVFCLISAICSFRK